MRETFDHEYPPGEWTAADVAAALRETEAASPLPEYGNEAAWTALREESPTAEAAAELLAAAEDALGDPMPDAPASRYLDFYRTENRTRYQDREGERNRRLATFALAECLEREGRFLDPILDYAWAVCEQSTWLLPAPLPQSDREHLEGLPRPVADEDRHVALRPATMAQTLAELDYVLGERLHPALRERIRHEVDRRVLTPYEARDDFHWMTPPANNWNAVCNAGAGIAALYLLEDPDRQGRLLAKAARSLEHYLADFDPDGCTAEGIGYWNYGFGNYVHLAATLEARTDGAFSLLSPPIVGDIAQYPLKVEMSPGRFVPFSDADEESTVSPFAACWLGERLDLPGLAARGRREFERVGRTNGFGQAILDMEWARRTPADLDPPTPARREYFDGYDWFLARVDPDDPDGLVVAAKGGHNGESHNHNDLGSFVVHYRGESLLTDLGSPTYDRDFFGEQRYEYLVARSLGHSVPYVDGCEQRAGEDYAAEVLERSGDDRRDVFRLDLAGAYPGDAGLDALERTITVDRRDGAVRLDDEASFAGGTAGTDLESVLVSYFPMEVRDSTLLVTGERGEATVTPAGDPPIDVERLADAVDASGHGTDESQYRDVWRARISAPEGAETERTAIGFDVDLAPRE
jgi:hypothetical protein